MNADNVNYILRKEVDLFIIVNIMAKDDHVLPKAEKALVKMGENIKLARLRRKISADLLAERAGISRPTLWSIERGAPSVGIGYYAMVLLVLGMESDLARVAENDLLGRKLQDAGLVVKQRPPKRK
jgi:DNA-binding XRE family transcriptional regulator